MSRTTPLKKLKIERTKQWGNSNKTARGWCRYRASTFLEVVGAKIDRCLQSQDLIHSMEDLEKVAKLKFDAHDSLLDAYNYLGKLVELVEKDPDFLINGRMP